MDLLHALVLALIQGLTEFLPISSSAHLILPFKLLGWPDQGLAFDTAVHLGSLLAVIWYFRSDIFRLAASLLDFIRSGGIHSDDSRFAFNLLIASLPLIPAGYFLKEMVESQLRSVDVIIVTTVLFGIVLFAADKLGVRRQTASTMTWKQALMIGLAQCLALVPGTSRSGITMTMGLLAGFTRESASRISFLISIPAIAGAATLKLHDLVSADTAIDWQTLGTGFLLSAISAYVCITLFLEFINRIGFTPFVIYRLLLGAVLLVFFI